MEDRAISFPERLADPPLVARFQHLHPICISHEANVGNKGTTIKFMILVEFFILTFDSEADITRVSNVKIIPLEQFIGARSK